MNILPRKAKAQEMPVATRQPADLFRSEFDRFVERFFSEPFGAFPFAASGGSAWAPALDVVESESELTVRAELPGLQPEDIQIEVSGEMLVLSGEKRQQAEESRENWYRAERRFGSFRRAIPLPSAVDADKVTAEYDKGVLVVHLPRTAESRPRRIQVKAAGS